MHLDTNAPTNQSVRVRLSINLEDDVYAAAKSLARVADCSIGSAVNALIRRGLAPRDAVRPRRKNRLPVVPCTRPFTSEDVYAADAESSIK